MNLESASLLFTLMTLDKPLDLSASVFSSVRQGYKHPSKEIRYGQALT